METNISTDVYWVSIGNLLCTFCLAHKCVGCKTKMNSCKKWYMEMLIKLNLKNDMKWEILGLHLDGWLTWSQRYQIHNNKFIQLVWAPDNHMIKWIYSPLSLLWAIFGVDKLD